MNDKPKWLDPVGAFVILTLTVAFMIVTIGPYFGLHPVSTDMTTAANQNAVVNNLFIAVLSFFIGGSVSNRTKDAAISTLAATAQTAQSALAPLAGAVPDKVVPIDAGEKVVVQSTEPKPESP